MFAGVAAGVVLPVLNKDGLGVACGPASPPGMLGCADEFLFAPADASLLPNPNVGGCAGVELGAAAPNNGVEDVVGFAPPPKRDEPELAPAPVFPNKLVPGGGPAGVVEGSANVLFGAGVAAGVEDPVGR